MKGVESTMESILRLLFWHLVGDFVFQTDYLASTKGKKWYSLFVHCALYALLFYFVFKLQLWQAAVIFAVHIAVDKCKCVFAGRIEREDVKENGEKVRNPYTGKYEPSAEADRKLDRLTWIDQAIHFLTAFICLI